MGFCNCDDRISCTVLALIVSAIVGVVAAFLHILGIVTATAAFLWVTFGIGVVYLVGLVLAAALGRRVERPDCACSALNAILVGLLGTVLLSLVLLAVGIVATSVLSAIGVGVLLFFLALALTASACYVRCANNCA